LSERDEAIRAVGDQAGDMIGSEEIRIDWAFCPSVRDAKLVARALLTT